MKTNLREWLCCALIGAGLGVAGCNGGVAPMGDGGDVRGDTVITEGGGDAAPDGARDVVTDGADAMPQDVVDVQDVTPTDGGDVTKDVPTDVSDVTTDVTDVVDVADATDVTDATMDVPMDVALDGAGDVTMDGTSSGCSGAIDLNTAGTLSGSTTSYTGDNSSAPATAMFVPMMCTTNTGGQVVFTYTTRMRAALTVSTVDPGTTFDTVAVAVSSCAAGATELGCNDDFSDGTTFTNHSQFNTDVLPAGTTVVIAIGGYGSTAPATGTFVLHVTELTEVAVGGTCDPTGATNVCASGSHCITSGGASTCVSDGTLGGECRATGTACDAPSVCNGFPDDPTSRCVPEVAVGGTCDPAGTMNVCTSGSTCITSGGTSTCVADGALGGRCIDTGTACDAPNMCNGDPTDPASRCVVVVALGGTCDPTGVMNVCAMNTYCATSGGASTCTALPYTESTTPAMCDDLSTVGIPITFDSLDDGTSGVFALPAGFAFSFFGSPVDNISVTTNGFLQLWSGATGTPSTAYFNANIPDTGDPNNFVAPFWDDLIFPDTGAGASTATFGTAPNRRFVVEWNNVQLFADRTASLRFQVKLFETTNVIELHYCSLMPTSNPDVTGGSATIGLEDSMGIVGIRHSYNTTGSVDTTNAIRFTP